MSRGYTLDVTSANLGVCRGRTGPWISPSNDEYDSFLGVMSKRRARLLPPLGLRAERLVLDDEELVVLSWDRPKPDLTSLTRAEREICSLLIDGLPIARIAAIRGTSPRTVQNQVTRVFDKLGVSSRAALYALLFGKAGRAAG